MATDASIMPKAVATFSTADLDVKSETTDTTEILVKASWADAKPRTCYAMHIKVSIAAARDKWLENAGDVFTVSGGTNAQATQFPAAVTGPVEQEYVFQGVSFETRSTGAPKIGIDYEIRLFGVPKGSTVKGVDIQECQ